MELVFLLQESFGTQHASARSTEMSLAFAVKASPRLLVADQCIAQSCSTSALGGPLRVQQDSLHKVPQQLHEHCSGIGVDVGPHPTPKPDPLHCKAKEAIPVTGRGGL
jgi:hypothetical protein